MSEDMIAAAFEPRCARCLGPGPLARCIHFEDDSGLTPQVCDHCRDEVHAETHEERRLAELGADR